MSDNYDWAWYDRENNRPMNLGDQPFDPHDEQDGYDDDDWDEDEDYDGPCWDDEYYEEDD